MDNAMQIELDEFMCTRAGMYEWLARLYRQEADHALLDALAQMDLAVANDVPEMETGYHLLKSFLAAQKESPVAELAAEYARIFLGVRRGASAFPYESVYTSRERLIMQEARDQVLQLYRTVGLERATGFSEPEDHLALELEFMAHLCRETAPALQSDPNSAVGLVRKQRDFLKEHLLRWVPGFCQDVERFAQLDFYKGVAHVTRGFLQADHNMVEELLHELESERRQ